MGLVWTWHTSLKEMPFILFILRWERGLDRNEWNLTPQCSSEVSPDVSSEHAELRMKQAMSALHNSTKPLESQHEVPALPSQWKAYFLIKNVCLYFVPKRESIIFRMIIETKLNVFLISEEKKASQLSEEIFQCWMLGVM